MTMKIKVKIYSCYKLTYSRIYKDIIKRLYGDNINVDNVFLEIEDISKKGTLNIQQQRSMSYYAARTVRIYEDEKLVHIVGVSNTNYDYDRDCEFSRGLSIKKINSFGNTAYHANTYLKQGINNIFNYYFSHKQEGVDLTFYLLDIEKSYPHNLFNVLSYRELETIGFKILNIDQIDFNLYEKVCSSSLRMNYIAFPSFSKYMRDISYVSNRNNGNASSFLECNEYPVIGKDGITQYITEKYIYTFKSLSAQGYDSLLRCWCMKVLANRENLEIEFRLGKQYFAYEEDDKKIADKLTGPILETFKNAGIVIEYISNEAFMVEVGIADNTYLRYKQNNELRNQNLFRNNIRKRGVPTECVLCGEDNAAILDAAHIWEVNKIKDASVNDINNFLSANDLYELIDKNSQYKNELFFKKYSLVNSGDNGVWMCKNHHGLFDNNYFCFDSKDGRVIFHFNDEAVAQDFLNGLRGNLALSKEMLSPATRAFLKQRMYCFSA